MKLKKLVLENFRLFKNLEIDFPDSNVIALIGNNGGGKTTILDAITIALTHVTGEIRSNTDAYNIDSWFKDNDISISEKEGKIETKLVFKNKNYSVSIKKDINQRGLSFNKEPQEFIKEIKNTLKNDITFCLPIISYHNVNRTFREHSVSTKEKYPYDGRAETYNESTSLSHGIYKDFENWFINEENKENSFKVKKQSLKYKLPSIENIRRAVNNFFDSLSIQNLKTLKVSWGDAEIIDFDKIHMAFVTIEKENKNIPLTKMSSGERMIINMVCDIARRLTIANNHREDALQGEGIVLIDELDLHLHPKWQREIVKALTTTFPKVQFIFTTHSPLIISGIRRENLIVLNDGEIIPSAELPNVYSGTADEIIEQIQFAKFNIDKFEE